MPFEPMPDFPGSVYLPETRIEFQKKHGCPDCHRCQMCSDDRCGLCRGLENHGPRPCLEKE